jgi:hypothetical protein
MTDTEFNRRDFSKLTVAAFTGMLAGTMAGCSSEKPQPGPTADLGQPESAADPEKAAAEKADGTAVAVAAAEVHLCKGLNTCKGLGGGATKGENACAGQGACATSKEHSCGTQNECKGLGGCGETAGKNECKGQGGCHVPLMEEAWKTVRESFEKKMNEQGKTFGNPPEKA